MGGNEVAVSKDAFSVGEPNLDEGTKSSDGIILG